MKKLLTAAALIFAVTSAHAADIVNSAIDAGNFKTLVTALKAADLVDTLKGPGPLTVFAPTDEAFAKLPKAKLDALLKDKAQLTKVLTYHVVAGKVMAMDVKPGKVKTLEGESITITDKNGVLKANNAKILKTDIVADNGVIHAIDAVLMPK
jgi:uncharacterized surface protein with fasciclin (FAS1) repeats